MHSKNAFNLGAFVVGVLLSIIAQNFNQIPVFKYIRESWSSREAKNHSEPSTKTEHRFETSGWCVGEHVDTRMCHFRNLCYHPFEERFVLVVAPNSTFVGFESDHNRYLLDMSGVPRLNVKPFKFDVVIADEFWNKSHPVIEMVDGPVFMLERYLSENIFHVLHDDILPLFWTYHDLCNGDVTACARSFSLVLLDRSLATDVYMLYRLFSKGPLKMKIMFSMNKLYCFEEAYVGLRKYSVWYDYTHGNAEGPVQTSMSGVDIQTFASWFEHRMCLWANNNGRTELCERNKETNKFMCAQEDAAHIVMLSRKRSRTITNEGALAKKLKKISIKHYTNTSKPIKIVAMETHSLMDIICYVRQSKLVVGMHGAMQTIASMFLRPGSGQIEMFPFAINPDNVTPFKTIAQLPGRNIVYRTWRNYDREGTWGDETLDKESGGLLHLTQEERDAVKNLTDVPVVKCCDHPAFKYWLYQDTKVDVDSVAKTVVDTIAAMRSQPPPPIHLPMQLIPAPIERLHCERKDGEIIATFTKPWNLPYIEPYIKDQRHEFWVGILKEPDKTLYVIRTNGTVVRWFDVLPYDTLMIFAGSLFKGDKIGKTERMTCPPLPPDEAKELFDSLEDGEADDFPLVVGE